MKVPAALRGPWEILRDTVSGWQDRHAPRMAAAIAFYTTFSFAPLLLLSIALAALLFGEDEARSSILAQMHDLIGESGAKAVEEVVRHARTPGTGILATVVGLVSLLVGASAVFGELQDALNNVWGIRKKTRRGIVGVIRDRFLSFAMVLGIGFLLLVSLVLSAMLTAMSSYFGAGAGEVGFLWGLNVVVSLGVTTLLFAAIFKVLPDGDVKWRDVWGGALITTVLFNIGKLGIGLYLGHSTIASAYGAAGSFVVFLLWIYYSCQIFLLGAEFTRTWSVRHGRGIRPSRDAERYHCEPGDLAAPEPPPRDAARRRPTTLRRKR